MSIMRHHNNIHLNPITGNNCYNRNTTCYLPASVLSIHRALSYRAAVGGYPVQAAGRVHLRPQQPAAAVHQHRRLHHRTVIGTGLIRLLLNHPRLVEYLPSRKTLGLLRVIVPGMHLVRTRFCGHFGNVTIWRQNKPF